MSNPSNNSAPLTESAVRADERARLATILESKEAQARPKSAIKWACFTALPAAAVIEMLAELPEEKESRSRASATAFLEAMEKEGKVDIAAAIGAAPAVGGDADKEARRKRMQAAGAAVGLAHGNISAETAAAKGVKIAGI